MITKIEGYQKYQKYQGYQELLRDRILIPRGTCGTCGTRDTLLVMTERNYWLGFSCFPGVGPKKFALLLEHFGTAEEAWIADVVALQSVLGKALTPKFIAFRKAFHLQGYEEKLQKSKVDFFTLNDDAYPELLKEISDPPFVLFSKGEFKFNAPENAKTIAIVGTRRITAYGTEVTMRLTEQLVGAHYNIISGLAFGVDAVAHKTCIDNGGKTVAVLGCGVDCCYPSTNKKLYDEIIQNGGAIVSEFPLSMQPSLGSFPSRNRIIAGLSQAVIVTEGAEDSGALYTAKDAFAVGRKVFAVPGPITSSLSKGPLGLIAKGAQLVTSIDDVLMSLGEGSVHRSSKRDYGELRKEEQEIVDLLREQDLHFDELVRKTQSDAPALGSTLSLLEMKGVVRGLAGGVYCLKE